MKIRKYRARDLPGISTLFYNTVHNMSAQAYSPQQLDAWAPKIYGSRFWKNRFKRDQVFVAEEGGTVIGFAAFDRIGYVDGCYVHHQFQHHGVGTALMRRIIIQTRRKAVPKMTAEVGVSALPFYRKMGFKKDKLRNKQYHNRSFKLYRLVRRTKFRKPVSRV